MTRFESLTLELSGTFDRDAVFKLLGDLAGVRARQVRLRFDAVPLVHGGAVPLLAAALRRLSLSRRVTVSGLPVHVANALDRLGGGETEIVDKRDATGTAADFPATASTSSRTAALSAAPSHS